MINKLKISISLIFLLSCTFIYGLEECKGTMVQEEVPCLLFLPSLEDCTTLSISVYIEDTYLYTQSMNQYNEFTCNATFNQTNLGTYTGNYTTGDSFSIIMEEDNMLDIFHLMVYGCFTTVALIMMLFMHLFKEDTGTSVIYGAISSACFAIQIAMLSGGFELINGVTFFFDIKYYIIALFASLSLYTGIVSYNLWRIDKPKKQVDYYG